MSEEFDGLNLIDLIDLLEEAPAPPPIPLTPQTWGWVVVGVVAAGLFALALWWVIRRYRARAYRRAALRALAQNEGDPANAATVLRRAALKAFPRDEVASLSGQDWLTFLDRTFPGSGFAKGPGQIFAIAPYHACSADPDGIELARDWIKHHRATPGGP